IEGLFELRRDHANHAERLAVEDQLFARQVWFAAQALPPQILVDDGNLLRALLVFAWRKRSPDEWLEVEDLKEIGWHVCATHAIRSLSACQVDALRHKAGQVFQRVHLCL